jgi:hypothetical protein
MLYSLVSRLLDAPADDPGVVEVADIVERLVTRAAQAGETGGDGIDNPLVDLLDAMVVSTPGGERVVAILAERGWEGWIRIERVPNTSRVSAVAGW